MARKYNVGAAMNRAQKRPTSGSSSASQAVIDVDRDDAADDPLLSAVAGDTAEEIVQAQEEAAERGVELPRYLLSEIAPHPFNPVERLDVDDELVDLGENIKEEGLHQPLVLAPRALIERDDPAAARLLADAHQWVLIAGHRRYAASKHVGLESLPGIQRLGSCTPEVVGAIFSDENLRRKAPSPLMLAQTWSRMRDAGMSTTAIGQRVGFSQPQVSKTLKLRALEKFPEVAAEMNAGRLTRDDGFAFLDEASEADRFAAFEAWKAEAGTESAKPLRAYLLRAQASADTASDSATSKAPAPESPASAPESPFAWPGPITANALSAILKTGVSATVRADMLADVALHIDEDAAVRTEWRALAEEVLGISLPGHGAIDTSQLSQPNRRKVATIRALVILDGELGRHADTDPQPPHVHRHIERLRALGAAG
ncbi:ParB/RepB/Spo0J family partition protein [Saccharopolyspora griseoalba]|uniref:ParB/RepB/Spo0J family partition protein n=1 Tax=Saccharopolyspora griseoalba TaxID=1431848 RepID=A0ABW2LUJ6_9PSEU